MVNWELSALLSLVPLPGAVSLQKIKIQLRTGTCTRRKVLYGREGQDWDGGKGIDSFPLILADFCWMQLPAWSVTLLMFYPASSQISRKSKMKMQFFCRVPVWNVAWWVSTGAAENLSGLLLFVMLGMQHKLWNYPWQWNSSACRVLRCLPLF